MGNLELIWPDANSLKAFSKLINPAIELIYNLNLQNKLIAEARNILLPKLLSGEINLQIAKLETA